jgi:hypothetical protein
MSEDASYSYQHGAGTPMSHQPATRLTRLHRRSLRFGPPHIIEPHTSLEEHDSDYRDTNFCPPSCSPVPEPVSTDSDTSADAVHQGFSHHLQRSM